MNIIEWININTKIPVSNRDISNGLVIESVLRQFFMINSEVTGEDTKKNVGSIKNISIVIWLLLGTILLVNGKLNQFKKKYSLFLINWMSVKTEKLAYAKNAYFWWYITFSIISNRVVCPLCQPWQFGLTFLFFSAE